MAQLDTKAQMQLGFSPAERIVCLHSYISRSCFIYQKCNSSETLKLPSLLAIMHV